MRAYQHFNSCCTLMKWQALLHLKGMKVYRKVSIVATRLCTVVHLLISRMSWVSFPKLLRKSFFFFNQKRRSDFLLTKEVL